MARGSRHGDRIARAQRRAGNDVDGLFRERLAVARGAAVGRQMDREAVPRERRGQRLGREQMAAGPAGGDEHRRAARLRHQAVLGTSGMSADKWPRGRSRVSAISMPMP